MLIIFLASSETEGAIITSVNISVINSAVSFCSSELKEIIPPKADVESHFKASLYASAWLGLIATPHGFACLIIATAWFLFGSNSETSSNAASVSLILL